MSLFLQRLMLMRSTSVVALSVAETLSDGETETLAIGFTDRSLVVIDTGTPANDKNYAADGSLDTFSSWFTYTSPSVKMIRHSDGLLKYAAHNLYLNSASPANQSITVVSGATYSVIITGAVSVTASGAATGTWTSGTNNFTASTTTLTLGSTSGSGTVQVTRTPADTTYLATTGAIRYALPLEYDASANPLGVLIERAATNLCLYSDDMTNAAWTKSNMSTAKTATGAGGAANAATTLTATAGNATALQSITSGSSARVTSCYIKRRTGTGNIDLTQNNGSSWTTVTVTSSWTRVELASVTSSNPTVGIRIVTSGDEVDVQYFQHEINLVTSPIATFGSTVTRAEDNFSVATTTFPFTGSAITTYAKFKSSSSLAPTATARVVVNIHDGTGNNRHSLTYSSSSNHGYDTVFSGASQTNITGGTVAANTVYKGAYAFAANDRAFYVNGASIGTDASSAVPTVNTLTFGAFTSAGLNLVGHLQEFMYLPRRMTNGDMGTLTT